MILDTVGMFDAVAAFPEQLEVAAAAAHESLESLQLPDHDDVANVVVLGMGTSGQAGSLVLEVAGPLMAIPVIAHRGYGVPNFVDSSTLVMAVAQLRMHRGQPFLLIYCGLVMVPVRLLQRVFAKRLCGLRETLVHMHW